VCAIILSGTVVVKYPKAEMLLTGKNVLETAHHSSAPRQNCDVWEIFRTSRRIVRTIERGYWESDNPLSVMVAAVRGVEGAAMAL
jgi:hypothetical protein